MDNYLKEFFAIVYYGSTVNSRPKIKPNFPADPIKAVVLILFVLYLALWQLAAVFLFFVVVFFSMFYHFRCLIVVFSEPYERSYM